jgi:FMN phosphatase YigB (HAD superfamily)
MPKSLDEYAASLDERSLLWPKLPPVKPVVATPYLKPLEDIRGVVWSLYGTLLSIADGQVHHLHPQAIRTQVALEKTIEEFKMWGSMTRKPGQPWETLLPIYRGFIEEANLTGTAPKGEQPEVDSADIWRKIVERLCKKEYTWDRDDYGDELEYAEKIAWFFHASLQAVTPIPDAAGTLESLAGTGLPMGLVSNGQCFSETQLLRGLRSQGFIGNLRDLFGGGAISLSWRIGSRQPAASLFRPVLDAWKRLDIAPKQILYVSSRLNDELAVAKKLGLRTALACLDAASLQATKEDVRSAELRPDRILTALPQVRQLVLSD